MFSRKERIFASILSGFSVSILNTIIEYLSDRYDLYRIEGDYKILSTPALLFILWGLLASIYALVSFRAKDLILLYIIAGIIGGWIIDLIGIVKGILIVEEKGTILFNFSVWVILVPLTVILSRLYMKLLFSR